MFGLSVALFYPPFYSDATRDYRKPVQRLFAGTQSFLSLTQMFGNILFKSFISFHSVITLANHKARLIPCLD